MFKEKINKTKKIIMLLSYIFFLFIIYFYYKYDIYMPIIQKFSIYLYLIIIFIYAIFLTLKSKHIVLYNTNEIIYKIKHKEKQRLKIQNLIQVTYYIDFYTKDIYYVFVTENHIGHRKTLHLHCKKYRRKDILKLLQFCIEHNKDFKYDILNNSAYNDLMNYKKQQFK